ncbi:DBH-like monooxygenase protein 1 [Orchesella cincta]|uniref:DBH-like monooxygenase protein 1 n=1 Tax=Orchesella cincta TaxID=48709 RepID=A0A1D2MUC3_ORCCI|nr:DBH-like monooxygenase protein 1 [Orchesella cincta]
MKLGFVVLAAAALILSTVVESLPFVEHNGNATTWKILTRHVLSSAHSSQHCSFHKSPVQGVKQHIFKENYMKSEYVHHVDLFRCVAPEGKSNPEVFDPFLREEGYSCTNKELPLEHCQYYCFWSCPIAPPENRFPENAGHAINEGEYLFMVIHYENPSELTDVKVESGVEFTFSHDDKEFDTAFLKVGRYISYKNLIPPSSKNFVVPHTCTSECTEILPQPIQIFGVTFHAHDSAMEIKLEHLRNGKSLNVIAHDKHYSPGEPFKFKKLEEQVKFLPGDELRVDCTYDTSSAGGKAMIGGNSLESEMCIAFIEYYPRTMKLSACGTSTDGSAVKKFFGIEDFNSEDAINPIVSSPGYLNGKSFTEVVQSIEWNEENRAQFQELMKNGPKEKYCSVGHHFE